MEKTQLNVRIPKDLHREIKIRANKYPTLDEYVTRVLQAAVLSEANSTTPGFLEKWEKFLKANVKK
jgi:hypothetical protein